jgi:hypothetical protein
MMLSWLISGEVLFFLFVSQAPSGCDTMQRPLHQPCSIHLKLILLTDSYDGIMLPKFELDRIRG